jgi:hypothetical protein
MTTNYNITISRDFHVTQNPWLGGMHKVEKVKGEDAWFLTPTLLLLEWTLLIDP